MKRGFTLVELLIVVSVITILSAITIAAFNAQEESASDAQASSMASVVFSAAEKYYVENNEYPTSVDLGRLTAATPPTNYNLASQKLGVPTAAFKTSKRDFVPCSAGANCSNPNLNKKYVYYATKDVQSEAGTVREIVVPIPNSTEFCKYTIPTSDVGATTYFLYYWSNETSKWEVARSNKGTVTLSKTTSGVYGATDTGSCPFKRL